MKLKSLAQNILGTAAFLILLAPAFVQAQQESKKPLEKVRLTVPAKSLTFVPYYFGKTQRLYEKEGIDLELIVMRPSPRYRRERSTIPLPAVSRLARR
jgi:hypothetical protein